MKKIRAYKKPIAMLLAWLQFIPVFLPLNSYALTGGPSAPEVQQFSPAGETEMVNLFTGDFNYQVPLLDIGGYPLTLSYSSNIGMEAEASMVGLGWNLNTGSIAREVRGLPDDLCGDAIQVTKSAKPKESTSFGAAFDIEFTGAEVSDAAEGAGEAAESGAEGSIGSSSKFELEYSTYEGWSAGLSTGLKLKGSNSGGFKSDGSLSVGMASNSQKGATVNTSASLGFEKDVEENQTITGGIGYALAVDSRAGIKKNSFGAEIGYKNRSLFGRNGTFKMNGVGVKDGKFTGGGDFNI
ncbi:MAG TPA: hypothetical protein VK174_01700, partial [Chitinophagales bacterium]|nr:hypothetical protein [Chitinophagales bacterium]